MGSGWRSFTRRFSSLHADSDLPHQQQLLDATLDSRSPQVISLFHRWNRLHAIRSILSAAAFSILLYRAAIR